MLCLLEDSLSLKLAFYQFKNFLPTVLSRYLPIFTTAINVNEALEFKVS